jgi:hypothetical protein
MATLLAVQPGHNSGVHADLLPAPPGLLWHSQDEGVPMLDDPEQTERLLAALKAAIPFEAGVSPEALRRLRARESGSTWAARQIVHEVSYLGDMGGIVCHLQAPEAQEVAVISLTHVRVSSSLPLAAQVARYQKHRIKKLRRQGGA